MTVPTFAGLHHVQLAIPAGGEDRARGFYAGVLGMTELEKPAALAARGGCWFRSGGWEVHLGVEPDFRAARKAHPGVLVVGLDALAERLTAAGVEVTWDDAFPGHRRIYAADPHGNRLELLEPLAAPVAAPGPDVQLRVGAGDPALDERLSSELDAHNVPAAGAGEQSELTVRVEDGRGELLAGLSGWTWGTSAGIAMVWVRDDQRGRGLGGRLLEAAEDVARQRGCERVHVSSFTFQAPGFYAAHGYRETGRTRDLPLAGQADVHFTKDLV